MLTRTTSNTVAAQMPPVPVIPAQFIAKATRGYPKTKRAFDAARWFLGRAQVKPTAKLAAATFGISVPMVAEAISRLEAEPANPTTTRSC
jgi:hypothetical protein